MRTFTAAFAALILSAVSHGAQAQTAVAPDNSAACVETFDASADYFPNKVTAQHSKLWSVSYHGNYKVVTVADTESKTDAWLRYVLVQCGTPTPELKDDLAGALVVQIPAKRVMVAHRNALAMIDELGQLKSVVGVTKQFLGWADKDPWYRRVVSQASKPQDIGRQEEINLELALSLEPDVIFMPGYGQGQTYVGEQRARGLPMALISNRTEPSPLGSSEWLKMIATFYNAESRANEIFATIEKDYGDVTREVADKVAGRGLEAAYGCVGETGGCGFFFGHGDKTLNGQILTLMGYKNSLAENNDQPNGRPYDMEEALGRLQNTSFVFLYWLDSGKVAATDPQYKNVPALAAGKYVAATTDNFQECNAVAYVRVDKLARDFAIGVFPELFPGEKGVCFLGPNQP
ncbi:MAG: ABC transporter substrate-binding protein [Rhizobium sp.]|nr:ABC transporter substrate-binding protein [Rhizobium sp.]